MGNDVGPRPRNGCPIPRTRSPSTQVTVPIAVMSRSPRISVTPKAEPGTSEAAAEEPVEGAGAAGGVAGGAAAEPTIAAVAAPGLPPRTGCSESDSSQGRQAAATPGSKPD